MQPISTVEKHGFKKLIKLLDPRYVLPGRKYFSHTGLPKMYAECREKVEEALQRDLTYFAPDVDSETNPLDWWKTHQKSFPKVSYLAKRYLCIPATSSPSERVFSTGGNIVTCHHRGIIK